MKIINKVIALIMAGVTAASCLGVGALAASTPDAVTIKTVEITQLPTKRNFYKGVDWNYGLWVFPESSESGSFVSDSKNITFLYHGGLHTHYEDRGMVDMRGLIVKVTYTDNTSKTVTYKETVSGNVVSENILCSPSGGEYKLGANTIEVYFKENPKPYDSYTINILTKLVGDVNGDSKVNSSDALMVLEHVVKLLTLTSSQKEIADVNSDGRVNSADALIILKLSVGLK